MFTPWKESDYLVLDIPEAIWWKEGKQRELLYLAHAHVPTTWSKQGVELERLEWVRDESGNLSMRRKLPNGIVFGTRVKPGKDAVRMEMWLTNGTHEPLSGLKVQACVMFKASRSLQRPATTTKFSPRPTWAAVRKKVTAG